MRASLLTLAFFSTLLGGVIADTDHHNPPPPPPPPPPHSHCPGGSHNYKPLYKSVYTVPHKSNADDVPAVTAALSKYGKNSTILFEKGVTYNIWTPLNLPNLTNVEISIQGNWTGPTNITYIQNIVANTTIYPGAWIKITGTNVVIAGSLDCDGGFYDTHGQTWWDANNQVNRPHGWNIAVTGAQLHDVKSLAPIGWVFGVGGNGFKAWNNKIYARSNNPKSLSFNTDGFNVNGINAEIYNNWIENGDDCFTVVSGAANIHFHDNYCGYACHGCSIGSLGSGGAVASVHNITMENNIMDNCLYGARFKSWTGGNGIAQNITWKNFTLINVPWPIYLTQNYWDQELGPKPNSSSTTSTHLQDVHFTDFTGTQLNTPFTDLSCVTDPCWDAVPGSTGKEIIILDLFPGTAVDITTSNIAVRTATGVWPWVMCDNSTVSQSPGIGFTCWDGPYVPTTGYAHAL